MDTLFCEPEVVNTPLKASVVQPVLVAKDLVYAVGHSNRRTQVLRGLSLDIRPGEKIAIIGPSGCGKSTLLSILGLLERPDSGSVMINGKDLSILSDSDRAQVRRNSIGFVFQFHFLLESFSLLENLLLGMRRYNNVPASALRERAQLLLSEVGLGEKIHRRPSELSGGEQQRVAVARALAHDPQLIFADEPTGNLDAETAQRVFRLMAYLANKKNQGMVLVTHNLLIAQQCDRILRMEAGQLISA